MNLNLAAIDVEVKIQGRGFPHFGSRRTQRLPTRVGLLMAICAANIPQCALGAALAAPSTSAAVQSPELSSRSLNGENQSSVNTTSIPKCERSGLTGDYKTAGSGSEDTDDFPQFCESKSAATHASIIWARVHLSGGVYGNNPDPMFALLRPADGHFVIYTSLISATSPGATVPAEVQYQYLTTSHPQGESPHSIYALLHRRGTQYRLLPLNFSPESPTQIELPWRPAQLSSVYDEKAGSYLLYPDVLVFLTPSWSPSIPSWEHFFVWWVDTKRQTIVRRPLPPGPWVADAKRDKILARDLKNFSCGTDCYRHFSIKPDAGNISVTISGKSSAVSEDVIGTYLLNPSDTQWVKVADGKPD